MAADPPEGGGRVVCVHDCLVWSVLETVKTAPPKLEGLVGEGEAPGLK